MSNHVFTPSKAEMFGVNSCISHIIAVNTRLLDKRQIKHEFQTCCGEHVAQTVDSAW